MLILRPLRLKISKARARFGSSWFASVRVLPAALGIAILALLVTNGLAAAGHRQVAIVPTPTAKPHVAISAAPQPIPSIATSPSPTPTSSTPVAAYGQAQSHLTTISPAPTTTPGPAPLPMILGQASMLIYAGNYSINSAQLNPRGNPDGTVNDNQILCNASGQTAGGQIYAMPWGPSSCSNWLSYAVFVHNGTPSGTYTLRAFVTSMTGVSYYGDIQVVVPPAATPPPNS